MSWSTQDIPDLTGKRAVVTGVTGGLGVNTAMGLAAHGADLIVTARDNAKAATAIARIEKAAPGATVDVVDLDLADLASVHAAAAQVREICDTVEILVNNAGVMATPERTTADGFELQLGTNHLGHFAWTGLLWPILVASDARIVTVASLAHSFVSGIDLRSFTPEGAPRRYRRWRSYGESKLANLSFALELNRRVEDAGLAVVSVAAHPGYAATNLTATGPSLGGGNLVSFGMHQVSRVIGQPAAAGAWPLLMAATQEEIPGGSYVGPRALRQMRGRPQLVGMSASARDEALADAVWAASESATGIEFTV